MRAFALAKTGEMLASMIEALDVAAAGPHEEAVHDLRVAIRRLQQALRVFAQFLPPKPVKRLRKRMKRIMEHAGELRNCDIALGLTQRSKALGSAFEERRKVEQEALAAALAAFQAPDLLARYRSALRLEAHEEAVEESPESA